MSMIKLSLLVLLLIILTGLGYTWWNLQNGSSSSRAITSFEECAAAGYPIRESYPEQCATPDGRTFTRNVDRVVPPEPPVVEGQPMTVTGEVTCLPHKDTSGPVTLECAFGIKDSASGNYYALSDPTMAFIIDLPTGEVVTVTGTLSEDPTSRYNIVGVIEITAVER